MTHTRPLSRLDGRSAGLAQALGHRHRLKILEFLTRGERIVAGHALRHGVEHDAPIDVVRIGRRRERRARTFDGLLE